jgi:hypothetical protein
MENEVKNSTGSDCACGKVDLYEEWLKQNDAGEKEEASNLIVKAAKSSNVNI